MSILIKVKSTGFAQEIINRWQAFGPGQEPEVEGALPLFHSLLDHNPIFIRSGPGRKERASSSGDVQC